MPQRRWEVPGALPETSWEEAPRSQGGCGALTLYKGVGKLQMKFRFLLYNKRRERGEILDCVPPCHFQREAFLTATVLHVAASKVMAEGALPAEPSMNSE